MNTTTEKTNAYATVYGSPGARVRFMGFFKIFWPFILVTFVAGWLVGCVSPVAGVTPMVASVLLIALALIVWWLFSTASDRFEAFLKGARGEEIVARELALLPADRQVFHGVPRSDFASGGGDIDHVVVSPNAVFVIETKNWEGPVTAEGGKLYVRGKEAWHAPVAQVRREVRNLATLLKTAAPDGLPILPVVCFASNGLEPDVINIDDVVLCNVRTLRTIMLATKGRPIEKIRVSMIVDTLVRAVS